jgi:hypothetical protein
MSANVFIERRNGQVSFEFCHDDEHVVSGCGFHVHGASRCSSRSTPYASWILAATAFHARDCIEGLPRSKAATTWLVSCQCVVPSAVCKGFPNRLGRRLSIANRWSTAPRKDLCIHTGGKGEEHGSATERIDPTGIAIVCSPTPRLRHSRHHLQLHPRFKRDTSVRRLETKEASH